MFGKVRENARQADRKFYVMYDTKTESYADPVIAVNDADFYRNLWNMFKQQGEQNRYYANAQDYQVFSIGDYCFKTGTISSWEPTHVLNCHELRAALESEMVQAKQPFGETTIPSSELGAGPGH